MSDIKNSVLLEKLEKLINTNTKEIKAEIKSINDTLNEKVKKLEEKCLVLENKLNNLERKNRRNNIVIFGLPVINENLIDSTLRKLNDLLGTNFTANEINNIYKIGKKNTIIVEFVSYLHKLNIFKNIKKLKNTGVVIVHDLSPEDQAKHKILRQHLKYARNKNHKAYIKNNKLYIDEVPYDAEQLEDLEEATSNQSEYIYETIPKANSAPPTPTIRRHSLEDLLDIDSNSAAGSNSATGGSKITSSTATSENIIDIKENTVLDNIENLQQETAVRRKKSSSSKNQRPANTTPNSMMNNVKGTRTLRNQI